MNDENVTGSCATVAQAIGRALDMIVDRVACSVTVETPHGAQIRVWVEDGQPFSGKAVHAEVEDLL